MSSHQHARLITNMRDWVSEWHMNNTMVEGAWRNVLCSHLLVDEDREHLKSRIKLNISIVYMMRLYWRIRCR